MFKLSSLYPEVEIKLDNGVYRFIEDSALGKTYLLSVIKAVMVSDDVIGFSYSDFIANGIHYESCVGKRVIMFDRYDMYAGNFKDIILGLKDSSIILLDCKYRSYLDIKMETCDIELSENRIEVFQ